MYFNIRPGQVRPALVFGKDNVEKQDLTPPAVLAAALALVIAAIMASLVPAMRASRVDVLQALGSE